MLVQIFERLPSDHWRGLDAALSTCKPFRAAIVNDAPFRHTYRMKDLAGRVARRATDPDRAVKCIPLLPLLDPKQRGKLVDMVIDKRNYGSARQNRDRGMLFVRAHNVKQMAPGVVYLDERQQTKLVKAVIDPAEDLCVASGICEFGAELAHLSAALRGELVKKAFSLNADGERVRAIAALSTGLAHLNPDQQRAIWTKTMEEGLPDIHRGALIRGLCTGVKHLDAAGRETLFGCIRLLSDGGTQASVVGKLGASLGSLSPDQRHTLVEITLDAVQSAFAGPVSTAIRGLVAGLKHLTLLDREALVTRSMDGLTGYGYAKSEVIAALGAGLAHLEPHLQDALLDGAAGLDTDIDKADAVAGLAAGLPSLNTARKARVVDMALSLPDKNSKARAIAALGARLGHLEQGQHNALVDAAILLFKTETVSTEMNEALGAGLGAGLRSLHEDLRSALVKRVADTLSPDDKQSRALIAEAMAAPRAGRAHLDEAQYKALIEGATWPQSRSGCVPFRKSDDHIVSASAAEAASALAT